MKIKINAIIVNYGTPDMTIKCVASVVKYTVASPQDIFVVDNASPDNSDVRLSRQLPDGVNLVRLSANYGFSAGVNQGVRLAIHDFLLVLNPDTYFVDDSINHAFKVFDNEPDVGLVGLGLKYPSGAPQYSGRRFYSLLDIIGRRTKLGRFWPLRGRIDQHLMKSQWDKGMPFDTDWVMGTGFLIRRELFNKIGGMDESFFLYMEDVDLCARIWASRHRVVCVPEATLIHDHQRSSAASPFCWAGRMHLKSLWKFSKKYRLPLFSPPTTNNIVRG